ncbi:hypothetical protein SE17_04550 [Kouleothrix aurantiaca]|uniref:Uncharacterized protein n=1 Tax=Kouleothrix aurantiaca TaxID=186479 RepID=A0A0P9HHM9_9CHLR|nr:hypothetical protein SE17_04550 [Kouleothrix aurantiaca]
MATNNINLQKFMSAQFNAAKWYLNLASWCSITVLAMDLFVLFTEQFQKTIALAAAVLVIASVLCLWRSQRLKDTAEVLLRRFELYKGLSWPVSPREISDLVATAPQSVKTAARSGDGSDTYFTSTRQETPKRLLENLTESAWWTKHQARRVSNILFGFSILVGILAVVTLIVSLQNASTLSQDFAENIAKAVIAIIVFLFTAGYIRLAFDYLLLAQEATKAEERACQLLEKPNVTEVEAIQCAHDYQLARAAAPLLPTWLWKLMQNELNQLWKERTEQSR